MNKIGAVNYINDSLARQKARQQRFAQSGRKKNEHTVEQQTSQEVEYPLASDPDSMIGHLLDTSA
jgi:hypothetical protein